MLTLKLIGCFPNNTIARALKCLTVNTLLDIKEKEVKSKFEDDSFTILESIFKSCAHDYDLIKENNKDEKVKDDMLSDLRFVVNLVDAKELKDLICFFKHKLSIKKDKIKELQEMYAPAPLITIELKKLNDLANTILALESLIER